MRRFLHRNTWATYCVVGLFMLAISGVAVSRMTCMSGGHVVVSVGTVADCCPEAEHDDLPMVKAQCCDLAVAQSEQQDYLPNPDVDLAPMLLALDGALMTTVPVAKVTPTTWLRSRPPPLDVPDRLSALSIRRV